MDRRNFLASSTALSGLAVFGSFQKALAQGTGPIKIGLLTPLTGVVASGGKEIVEGFNLYWDQVGKKAGGREVQIFIEDDGSNPDIALQKARKLTEQTKVDFLVGDLLANTGLAVAEYRNRQNLAPTSTPPLVCRASNLSAARAGRRPKTRAGAFSASWAGANAAAADYRCSRTRPAGAARGAR